MPYSNFYIYILFLALFFSYSCKKNNDNEVTIFCPEGYELLLRDEFESFWEATVRYYELDPQGVMHNANHVAFLTRQLLPILSI